MSHISAEIFDQKIIIYLFYNQQNTELCSLVSDTTPIIIF